MSAGKTFCTKQQIMYWYSKKKYILNLAKTLITVYSVDKKQYLNNVPLRTVRYSCRLSTAGTTLLFTQSVNSTNITVHILQCVTVMNQYSLQHFPWFHFNSTFTHKTASHKRSVNIFPVINLHFSFWWLEMESDSYLNIYYHVNCHMCVY